MTLRSRLATATLPPPVVPVAKVFGPGIPPAIEAAEQRSQMGPQSPFSPGEPIGPYDGFSRTPRSHDYVTGYNIATRPRVHERVAFETLKGLIDSYDVARVCIRHRIASLRSLDFKLVAADGYEGEIAAEVAEGKRVLKRPDRKTLFKPWLAKYVRGILSYDAGTLYRMRNRAGRAVGLTVLDGTMIAPLQDYWGNPPDAPAPAYVQYVQGLPWNWLTSDDLVYEPYDPRDDSLYGTAPLEDILLTANTDIRFQLYFLERFTQGNLPAGFASSPDNWSPDQIEQFQEYWDAFMLGDQSRKHQIRWIPSGSKLAWTNEKDFTDSFSLFLMRKACSAFSIVPSDLGFTESVNKSSGESQADVQHRVGDLPMAMHIQDILTEFLQGDLQLPLKFAFDLGEEQDDRLNQAQSDKIYFDIGSVGSSELRELRYGWTDPVPIPRTIMTSRGGPVPIASLLAIAGEIDPATALPAIGAPLPKDVFGGVEGVLPEPPIKVTPLAEREYGPSAMPPAPPPQPVLGDDGQDVAKEGDGGPAPAAGIAAETGIYGYDLDDGEDSAGSLPVPSPLREEDGTAVAKRYMTVSEARSAGREARERELAVFRRFSRARRKAGEWRDFAFEYHSPGEARELNRSGAVSVAKAAGEIAVAGLAVLAADTGRVLMLQRALDPDDPAGGTWEVPGGHLEAGETPLHAAWREWSEEVGLAPPPGTQTGSWTSPNGIYQGIVWTVDSESLVPVRCGTQISNPDDPDGDSIEAVAWWDPEVLLGNPAVRPELLANIDEVMAALGVTPGDSEPGEVAKAGGASPKRPGPDGPAWPGWALDLPTADFWSPKVTAAARQALSRNQLDAIASAYAGDHQGQDGSATGKRDRKAAAVAWLRSRGVTVPMGGVAQGIAADSVLIGGASASAAASGNSDADTGDWKPGDAAAAGVVATALGLGALLTGGAGGSGGELPDIAGDMGDGYIGVVAQVLAGWDADVAADELAGMLADAVADGAYATALTVTQITVVSGLAAHEYYLANTKSLLQWIAVEDSRTCPACMENAAAEPRRAGQDWPGGVPAPPQHPGGCRCALVPVWLSDLPTT
jgi:8-oxo-dGTP pyrophosphatase MutT (NUDIX family)